MPKQARSFITRDRIVESAALVFDRYGYAGTTLSDIVRQSGTTKGSVYFHFSSKEQVAVAVVEAQHERSVGLGSALAQVRGIEAMIRVSHMLARQLIADPLVRAGVRLTLEQGSITAAMSNPYKGWIDMIHSYAQEALADGEMVDTVDPEALANFVVGAFTGVQMLSGVISGRADLMRRIQQFWVLLLPALVSARKVSHYQRINTLEAETAA